MTSRLSALAFGALLLGASSWPAHAALVGFWGFDESTGTVAHDSSGSGNDALLMNGATFCTTCGITGGALDLTHGGFAEVGTAYNYSGYTPFSIQAWVRFANPGDPTYSFAVARHHSTEVAGYTIELNRTVGYANVYQTYPTTPPAPAVINDGSWHQLVAVFGSSATSIYVDGNHVGTTARVPFPSPSFANFLIGGHQRCFLQSRERVRRLHRKRRRLEQRPDRCGRGGAVSKRRSGICRSRTGHVGHVGPRLLWPRPPCPSAQRPSCDQSRLVTGSGWKPANLGGRPAPAPSPSGADRGAAR